MHRRYDDGKEHPEWTLTERRELEFDGMPKMMRRHFMNVVWWPAILIPGNVIDEQTGKPIREARNIVTGEIYKIEERELIPFEWIPPDYSNDDARVILTNVKQDIRKKYGNAWLFAMRLNYHNLDYSTIRIMLGFQRARRFHPHVVGRYGKLHRKLTGKQLSYEMPSMKLETMNSRKRKAVPSGNEGEPHAKQTSLQTPSVSNQHQ
ncbi:unnamed protein product [Caenorhabditis nigoni]